MSRNSGLYLTFLVELATLNENGPLYHLILKKRSGRRYIHRKDDPARLLILRPSLSEKMEKWKVKPQSDLYCLIPALNREETHFQSHRGRRLISTVACLDQAQMNGSNIVIIWFFKTCLLVKKRKLLYKSLSSQHMIFC